jgi:hypothetical protein
VEEDDGRALSFVHVADTDAVRVEGSFPGDGQAAQQNRKNGEGEANGDVHGASS